MRYFDFRLVLFAIRYTCYSKLNLDRLVSNLVLKLVYLIVS